ncbi:MAG: PAS domain-containing sensor histidine kinase [Bacteroidetes bacterium]|nr:PAS domain-containing sensor histidine kinase [Bacteroidota bacterium]HET6242978.1 PAS domain-containing sensor histidine kinase [Bacteroidia bacterium]
MKVEKGQLFQNKKNNNPVDPVFSDTHYIAENNRLNNLLMAVINSSEGSVFIFNSVRNNSGEIVDFKGVVSNLKSKEIINIDSKDFPGKYLKKNKLIRIFFPEDFINVVETSNDFSIEFQEAHDNSIKWYRLLAVKESDGIVVTLTDITEKTFYLKKKQSDFDDLVEINGKIVKMNSKLENRIRRRTKELYLSEERVKLLSKATNDAVWDWDLSRGRTWWNEGYYALFGYSDQYVQLGNNSWFSLVHPDDYHRITGGIKAVLESSADQWNGDFRFLKADGNYAFVLGRAYVLHDKNEKPIRIVGSMIDVSEIKQAQDEIIQSAERTRLIAELMPQKVWTADSKGNMNYLNPRWMEYTGLGFDELKNWGWQKVIHREDLFETTRLWKHSIETGQDFQIEHKMAAQNGKFYWHLTRGVACRDVNGKIINWVGTNTDIHDKIVSEERKDEFIGVASHELKTPLTSLKAYTQLLEITIDEENIKDSKTYIKKTNTFINRLDELISDLLDISKMQAGKLQYNMSEFKFDDLIKESIECIKQTHKTHKIIVNGKSRKIINADKTRLEQVFVNFLSNAIKYSPKSNKVNVDILANKDGITVGVKDYGIGIDNEKAKNVFQRFYRVEGMSHKFQGLGLGLYISAQIIERHGGKYWVESEEGVGSTFWFSLPYTCLCN